MTGSGISDLPSWWTEYGAAGWAEDLWLFTTSPWTLLGHTMGSWSLVEPDRAPNGLPHPGVLAMQTPIVFYDSVAVTCGEGGGWNGFNASLATATGITHRMGKPSDARTVIDLRGGDFDIDENALMIERGDSSLWVRGETVSDSRALVNTFSETGRHVWDVAGGFARGRHALFGTFAQRGAAFAMLSGDEQGTQGESGAFQYRARFAAADFGLRLERGHDHHNSFNLGVPDFRPFSRRDAQENVGVADAVIPSRLGRIGFKVEGRRALISRTDAFERSATSAWAALQLERGLGEGVLRLEIGGGRQSWTGTDYAPAISYRLETPGFGARIGFERLLVPVWADLAPDQAPFLQRTWAGVVEAALRPRSATHARATFLFGRTTDRALVNRLPMEELWMRFGMRAEGDPYDFGALMIESVWDGHRYAAGANGYYMGSDENLAQPLVDPRFGYRVWGALRFTAFKGDLGGTIRAEIDGVGDRQTEGELTELTGEIEPAPSRPLSPYLTTGVSAIFTLAGATITFRVRNLEDQRQDRVWFDAATLTEAVGPGRELRVAVTVRLRN